MSRKTRLYRAGSPSISQRNRALQQTARYAEMVEHVAMTLVKSFGSSLKEDEWNLTIPANDVNLAKPYENLTINQGPNAELLLHVGIREDLKEQVAAFKAEIAPKSGTVDGVVNVNRDSDPAESQI